MLKDKRALFTGLSLALCFCALQGSGLFLANLPLAFRGQFDAWFACLMLASYSLPFCLLRWSLRGEDIKVSFRRGERKTLGFVTLFSLVLAFLSAFLNGLVASLGGVDAQKLPLPSAFAEGAVAKILIGILLLSLLEEVFLRGLIFSSLQKSHGTGSAIVLMGFVSAMLTGGLERAAGAFVVGAGLSYVTFVCKSVWPAVFGRMLIGFVTLGLFALFENFGLFGLWNYFLIVTVLAVLLGFYFALRRFEKVLERGTVKTLQKGHRNFLVAFLQTIVSPGFLVFVLLFLTKAVFSLW